MLLAVVKRSIASPGLRLQPLERLASADVVEKALSILRQRRHGHMAAPTNLSEARQALVPFLINDVVQKSARLEPFTFLNAPSVILKSAPFEGVAGTE